NGFAEFLIQKVVDTDFLRFALRLPFPTAVFEVAYQFFLFGIDRDHRLTTVLERRDGQIDMLELRIPIRMSCPFSRLAIALQTVACRFQQATHSRIAYLVSLCRQLPSQGCL